MKYIDQKLNTVWNILVIYAKVTLPHPSVSQKSFNFTGNIVESKNNKEKKNTFGEENKLFTQ